MYLARDLISLLEVSRKGLLFLLSLFSVCAVALLLLQSTHTQVEERETYTYTQRRNSKNSVDFPSSSFNSLLLSKIKIFMVWSRKESKGM